MLPVRGNCSWGFAQSVTISPHKTYRCQWSAFVMKQIGARIQPVCFLPTSLHGDILFTSMWLELSFLFVVFSNRRPSAIVPFLFYCPSISKQCSASIVCLRVCCIIAEVWIINWSVEYILLNDSIVCTLSFTGQLWREVRVLLFFFFILIICSTCDVLFEIKTRPDFWISGFVQSIHLF